MRTRRAWAAAGLLGLLIGCGPQSNTPEESAEQLSPWPFTVSPVWLSCEGAQRNLFVTTADGRRFAVNGTARSEAPLMRDIQGAVDLGPLIRRGLELCDAGGGRLKLEEPPREVIPVAPSPPRYTIEPAQWGGGNVIAAEAQEVVDGRRPTLSFTCRPDAAPMVMLDVVRAPRRPPPLRDVYGRFQVGTGAGERLELSWSGSNGIWTLRGDDRRLDRDLVEALLADPHLAVFLDTDYFPQRAVSWDLTGFGEDLARVRALCG